MTAARPSGSSATDLVTTESLTQAEPWCHVADVSTVEARFGVRDCGPAPVGNQCIYQPPSWVHDSGGRLRAGALMVVTDHILGELSFRRRPPEVWSLTTELTLDLIADIPPGQTVHASACEVASARGSSFAHCRLDDGTGRILALGTTRTVYVPATQTEPPSDALTATRLSGAATIEDALDVSYRTDDGSAVAILADTGEWANIFGILHGGVASCVAELAAFRVFNDSNSSLSTARIHTNYLRPASSGTPYQATARAYRVGRGFAVVEVLGHSGGQLCTVSMITARRADTSQEGKRARTL